MNGPGGSVGDMESERFVALFHEAYLAFHRRSGRRGQLTNASRSVLLHLAQAGPLSIGEAARHLDRAQSVVSDIVAQLEDKGLLERERDPSNGRRTLVWLTPEGLDRLREDSTPLDVGLVASALDRLDTGTREGLLRGLAALVETGTHPNHDPRST